MATITHVGLNSVDKGAFNAAAVALAVPSPGYSPGDLAILCVYTSGGSDFTISDSQGNTWAIDRTGSSSNGQLSMAIFSSTITHALSASDTVSVACGNNRRWIWSFEKITLQAVIPKDGTGGVDSGSASSLSWDTTVGTVGDYVVSLIGWDAIRSPTVTGWTTLGFTQPNLASVKQIYTGFQIAAGSPVTCAPSWAGASGVGGVTVAYKLFPPPSILLPISVSPQLRA